MPNNLSPEQRRELRAMLMRDRVREPDDTNAFIAAARTALPALLDTADAYDRLAEQRDAARDYLAALDSVRDVYRRRDENFERDVLPANLAEQAAEQHLRKVMSERP